MKTKDQIKERISILEGLYLSHKADYEQIINLIADDIDRYRIDTVGWLREQMAELEQYNDTLAAITEQLVALRWVIEGGESHNASRVSDHIRRVQEYHD